MRRSGRNEGPHLRHDHDQRALAQECRLARHIRSGQKPDALIIARQRQIIGDERRAACLRQYGLDHWMTALLDIDAQGAIDDRADIISPRSQFGESR